MDSPIFASDTSNTPGALVISLDFELHWGLASIPLSDQRLRARLLRTRELIPRLLALFEEFRVAATWATVGRLFARSASEMRAFAPVNRPGYSDAALWTGTVTTGNGEVDDPFHFAPSLIEAIGRTPRQEIGTHTFSHFYCLEAGQTSEDFAADLAAACDIARQSGHVIRSIVYPRNQANPSYFPVLIEHGITAYRGSPGGPWRPVATAEGRRRLMRLGRLVDSYAQWTSHSGLGWNEIIQPSGLANVRATSFLRPYEPRLALLEELRLDRISGCLRRAARRGRIVHLWWHPHNFGMHPEENMAFLRRILTSFSRCAEEHGMLSLGIGDAGEQARRMTTCRQVTVEAATA